MMKALRSWSLGPALLFLATGTAFAQNPAPAGEDEGSPVPGYIATAVIASGAIFVLCKSARR